MKATLAYLCGSTSWGGLEMNHLRNAEWMKERGHDVIVIGISGSPFEERAHELKLAFIGIPVYRKYYDFQAARSLVQCLKEHEVTHLLTRSSKDLSITAMVKRKMKSEIHTSYFMEMQLGVNKKSIAHTLRYKYLDLWSCPLHWLKVQVIEKTRFRNELVVIPSGIDLSTTQQVLTQREARKQLNLPDEELIFGLVGRFDPQKGQLLLLEAMRACSATNFRVVLLGEPTKNEGHAYVDQLKSVVQKLGDRVLVRPFRKDISTFYKAIDWMVMATKAETVGMVTIESLAHGTPVLGSNAGGTPEILSAPKGGYLFESMNAQELGHQLDFIAKERPQMVPEQLKSLVKEFDHHKVCEAVERALHIRE